MDSKDIMSAEDAIEKAIGPFGKYQIWILILISVGRLPTEYQLSNVVFILPRVNYKCLDSDAQNATSFCPCENPEYDQSTIASSVTSEWNLICNRTSLASFAQSVIQIGILAGSLIYGNISDRYGRKLAVLLALFLTPLCVVLSALVPDFWMFLVARFLIGVSLGGTMLCCYTLIMELCGKSFRPYLVGLHEVSIIIGNFSLPGIAYFVRDWRNLQLITGAPWIFVIAYYWLIPESPRWLITVGKKKEAMCTLTHIAKINSRSTECLEAIVNEIEKEVKTEKQYRATYVDLFRTPKIRVYTVLNAFVWMFCAHTYFGSVQFLGQLQGNLYLNMILFATCLLPALVLVVIATLCFKRKATVIVSFSTTAISLLVFILIPSTTQATRLTFAIIGLTGAYTSFVLIYLYCTETFPTVIRNSALGYASVFARLGSFIAPFVLNIGIEWISVLIFSSLSFFSAFLCTFLPETKDMVLLNSIDQIEKINKKVNAPQEKNCQNDNSNEKNI